MIQTEQTFIGKLHVPSAFSWYLMWSLQQCGEEGIISISVLQMGNWDSWELSCLLLHNRMENTYEAAWHIVGIQ